MNASGGGSLGWQVLRIYYACAVSVALVAATLPLVPIGAVWLAGEAARRKAAQLRLRNERGPAATGPRMPDLIRHVTSNEEHNTMVTDLKRAFPLSPAEQQAWSRWFRHRVAGYVMTFKARHGRRFPVIQGGARR